MSRMRALGPALVGGLLAIVWAGPAPAAPAMFIGNVAIIADYRDGVHCGANVYGPDQGPCRTNGRVSGNVSSPIYTASVAPNGAISVPPWVSWQGSSDRKRA